MRVLIIGVGGVGAAAAWRLAQAGVEVVALEQFRLDHDRGSSYGDSRIVRRVYPDALYTALMADAYPLWDALQAQSPQKEDFPWPPDFPEGLRQRLDDGQRHEIFRRAGGIYFGPAQSLLLKTAQNALTTSGVEHEVLNAEEANRRFPAFRLRPDEIAIYEPSMGYARASHALWRMVKLAQQHGAKIIVANPVREIEAVAEGVRVKLASGETFEGDRLLLTAGAWTGPLLEPFGMKLPLVVTRQPYIHLKPARQIEMWEAGRFPVWIDAGANAYGFPRLGQEQGLKIGLHDHGESTTPERVERNVREADRETLRAYAAQRFPDLSGEVVYEKVCLYTNTPDEDFIIDTVPGLSGAFVISACSGHGFKFTPLLGQIAADLLTDQPVPYDLSRFRLSRFPSL